MINKKGIIVWTLCSSILIAGIHYLDGMPLVDDWPGFLTGVFLGVLCLVVASIILSVIIACFRFKGDQMPNKLQIKHFIPLSTILLTIISFIVFILSRPSYATATAAEPFLCQNVKEGRFQLDEYTIERTSEIQIEKNMVTKEESISSIKWINDCEYELVNSKDVNDVTMVKIIEVTNQGYKCIVTTGDRATRHELTFMKNGN